MTKSIDRLADRLPPPRARSASSRRRAASRDRRRRAAFSVAFEVCSGFQPSSFFARSVFSSTGLRTEWIHDTIAGRFGTRAITSAVAPTACRGSGIEYQPSASARSLIVSVPLPARLYGPGAPRPWIPATNADATSSSCTSWNGVPGSGSTGFRIGIDEISARDAVGQRLAEPEVGELLEQRLRQRAGDDARPEHPGVRLGRLEQRLGEDALDLGLLLRVEVLGRAARLDVLGQPVRVVVVEAVGRDARRVGDALGAGLDRGVEHVPRPVDVDRARGVAGREDREREVDDDVGALDRVADALLVLHVALAVLGLLPALVARVELAAGHADDLLHLARASRARRRARFRGRRWGR